MAYTKNMVNYNGILKKVFFNNFTILKILMFNNTNNLFTVNNVSQL